jgi:hypothetical protein
MAAESTGPGCADGAIGVYLPCTRHVQACTIWTGRGGLVTRTQIIALSVVCCVFCGLALVGPNSVRGGAYAVNFVLVIVCIVVAGPDLTRRGWNLGYLFAAAYLVPFIGLIVYVALCSRPIQEPAIAPSSDLVRHGAAVLDPYPSDADLASQRQTAESHSPPGSGNSVSAQMLQ